jgi:hypothetical protein
VTAAGRPLLTAACAIGGTALFAYVVRRAGVSEIIDGIQRVGWGLTAILLVAGLRFVLRAQCWRYCMPAATQLTFRQAFGAFLAGDAIGSVTPLGLLASEPTKIFLTRHHLATRESVASLAAENLIYGASVIGFIGVGLAVVLATVPLPAVWQWIIAASLAGVGVAALVILRALRGTWDPARGPRPEWRARLAAVRQTVVGFSTGHRGRLWRAFALDLGFHGLGIVEVFLTLRWLLADRSPTIAQAVAFEALNRAVTVAFKFVPFRIGIDEALSGAAAPALALNPAAGVALAVVRKVRNLFWTGIGLAVIAAHPSKSR